MRNSIFLSRRAEKFLAALRDAKLYSRLRTAIDDLEQNARPFGCVKLAGEPDLYRIRVNDLELTVLGSRLDIDEFWFDLFPEQRLDCPPRNKIDFVPRELPYQEAPHLLLTPRKKNAAAWHTERPF